MMNPMVQAMAGSLVRALMMFAGAQGIELGNEQAETIVNAILVIGSVGWSLVHKKKVDQAIKEAKAGA